MSADEPDRPQHELAPYDLELVKRKVNALIEEHGRWLASRLEAIGRDVGTGPNNVAAQLLTYGAIEVGLHLSALDLLSKLREVQHPETADFMREVWRHARALSEGREVSIFAFDARAPAPPDPSIN